MAESIRVFVGSPNEIAAHRRSVRGAIDELNENEVLPLPLEYVDWQDATFPVVGRPQKEIFDAVGPYGLFVGLFAYRLGSPTDDAASGTVDEVQTA
jgi:hypothetical protein